MYAPTSSPDAIQASDETTTSNLTSVRTNDNNIQHGGLSDVVACTDASPCQHPRTGTCAQCPVSAQPSDVACCIADSCAGSNSNPTRATREERDAQEAGNERQQGLFVKFEYIGQTESQHSPYLPISTTIQCPASTNPGFYRTAQGGCYDRARAGSANNAS